MSYSPLYTLPIPPFSFMHGLLHFVCLIDSFFVVLKKMIVGLVFTQRFVVGSMMEAWSAFVITLVFLVK